jgi:t-SNARE complex subunit (syntaxin)
MSILGYIHLIINFHSGSLIQVIEYETENASKNVDKGADELEKARELQIKALKKKTYILIILLIVLGIVLADFFLNTSLTFLIL